MSAIWDRFKDGKENPFYTEPFQKGFYHPSPPRKLDRNLKKTLLNPDHRSSDVSVEEDKRENLLNVRDGVLHIHRVGELSLLTDGESVSFNESWPQSERPSTVSIPEIEILTPPFAVKAPESLFKAERDTAFRRKLLSDEDSRTKAKEDQESTLSKYVSRFRNAQPMSRDERLKTKSTDPEDFWWMSSPVPQMRPADGTRLDGTGAPTLARRKFDSKESLSKPRKHSEQGDAEDCWLENANSLLEKLSDSVGSSHPAVSTIGLGSDSGGTVATFDEEPFRPSFIETRERSTRLLPSTLRPEDDILYRYRLRRKRELAKLEAERRRLASDSGLSANQLPSRLREPQGHLIQSISEKTMAEPSKPYETLITQQLNGTTEAKKDAVVQTSEKAFNPYHTYVPIACPHIAPGGMVSVVGPHCHFNCDILSANHSAKVSEHKSLGDDGQEEFLNEESVNAVKFSGKSARERQLDKHLPAETEFDNKNKVDQSTEASIVDSPPNLRSTHKDLNDRNSSAKKISRITKSKSVQLPETRVELSDTEVWHTTDNEQNETRQSFEAKAAQKDRRSVWNSLPSDARRRDLKYAGGEPVEDESELQNSRLRQRKPRLPKNRHSAEPVHSTVDKAFVDRSMMMTSVSSLENFELSSLDLEDEHNTSLTEADEPVHDSSVHTSSHPHLNLSVDSDSIFSDGEEFKEDDILSSLRARRRNCIQRLKELDKFILNAEKS